MKYSLLICLLFLGVVSCKEKAKKITLTKTGDPGLNFSISSKGLSIPTYSPFPPILSSTITKVSEPEDLSIVGVGHGIIKCYFRKLHKWVTVVDTSHSPEFNVEVSIDYKNSKPCRDSAYNSFWQYMGRSMEIETVGKGHNKKDKWSQGYVLPFKLGDTDRNDPIPGEFDSPQGTWVMDSGSAPKKDTDDYFRNYHYRNGVHKYYEPPLDTAGWGHHNTGRIILGDTSENTPLPYEFNKPPHYRGNGRWDSGYGPKKDTADNTGFYSPDPLIKMENAVHCPYNKPTKESIRKEKARTKKYLHDKKKNPGL